MFFLYFVVVGDYCGVGVCWFVFVVYVYVCGVVVG